MSTLGRHGVEPRRRDERSARDRLRPLHRYLTAPFEKKRHITHQFEAFLGVVAAVLIGFGMLAMFALIATESEGSFGINFSLLIGLIAGEALTLQHLSSSWEKDCERSHKTDPLTITRN